MASHTDHTLTTRLTAIIPATELNSWESDEILACLAERPAAEQELLLRQIAVIWPVSHSLCLAFLEAVQPALVCLDAEQFAAWVRGILHCYEAQGLQEARRFMAALDSHFVCTLKGESGLVLAAVKNRLGLYLRGMAGRPFELEAAPWPGTDTATIFLPASSRLFADDHGNFLVYKLLASLQWAFIRVGLYCHGIDDEAALFTALGRCPADTPPSPVFLRRYFSAFDRPETAMAIYHFLQTWRALDLLQKRLPGLMADAAVFFRESATRQGASGDSGGLLAAEYGALLGQLGRCQPLVLPEGLVRTHCHPAAWQGQPQSLLLDTARIYEAWAAGAALAPVPPPLFQGTFLPDEAHARRLARRQEVAQQFIEALSIRILPALAARAAQEPDPEAGLPESPQHPDSSVNLTLRLPFGQAEEKQPEPLDDRVVRHLRLDDDEIALDTPLQELGREIMDDLGQLPQFYLDAAAKLAAGRSYDPSLRAAAREGGALHGENLYDEWDFRRQGFRRDWCRLLEKEITPSGGTFIATALAEQRGVIKQLKRQFEQLKSHHRFVGRQRDGDDIDLDALTEALADHRAGLPPSERLFVRQLRDQRDIAALFLVDMSSSTEGWVGKAIKESLLVMAEAMEGLGDRYAIYGFSGMRRTRSEIFRIKAMTEAYGATVQGRIAALGPKDYTRMGPPIRHCSRMLAAVEARVRLLIILTDGKPEDYDDYKGEYAIEDTRHALIEAKNSGIHPFCITIDRQAQDYMAHLFGPANSLCIDEVKKLPRQLPDIYRRLTS
jgi:nitric oxide reductase NorD protein